MHKPILTLMTITLICAASLNALASDISKTSDASDASDIVLAFHGLCVANEGHYHDIEKVMPSIGGKRLPMDFVAGDPILGLPGTVAYTVPSFDGPGMVVAYVEEGDCTIISADIDPDAVREVLALTYKPTKVSQMETDASVTEVYLGQTDKTAGGPLLSLTYPKDYPNDTIGTLSLTGLGASDARLAENASR